MTLDAIQRQEGKARYANIEPVETIKISSQVESRLSYTMKLDLVDDAATGGLVGAPPKVMINDLPRAVITTDIQSTLNRISAGVKFPHRNDGSVFMNREGLLPNKPAGYYKEFVHPTPNIKGPGPQRVVTGLKGEAWYTPDHYKSFQKIK